MKNQYNQYPSSTVEAVAGILGETHNGLTNREIERILGELQIADPVVDARRSNPAVRAGLSYVALSKRDRIRDALLRNQQKTNTGNALIAFVTRAMDPRSYTQQKGLFEVRQEALNEVLAFVGLRVNDEGKVARVRPAKTLSEAAERAGRLTGELLRRGTHPLVLTYCTEEVLARNNFHAALEAVKGVAQRLREFTGLDLDGQQLATVALACQRESPPVAINPLLTQSQKDEQTGLMNMIIGLFGMYRNPTAHDAKVVREAERPITEPELLELFTSLSLIHHALDGGLHEPRD